MKFKVCNACDGRGIVILEDIGARGIVYQYKGNCQICHGSGRENEPNL